MTQVSVQFAQENLDFTIALGGEREELDILWTDATGRLVGRRFEKAIAQFRAVCRSDPENPDAALIALVPEVLYAVDPSRAARPETPGLAPRAGRAAFILSDLAAEVKLPPGRLLVLGARRTSDVSLGGALFYERRGPDVWAQTIILTAERAVPGQAPEGGTRPFLPPAGTTPKPPAQGSTPPSAPPAP